MCGGEGCVEERGVWRRVVYEGGGVCEERGV